MPHVSPGEKFCLLGPLACHPQDFLKDLKRAEEGSEEVNSRGCGGAVGLGPGPVGLHLASLGVWSGNTHPSLSQGLRFDFQRESTSPDKVGLVPLKPACSGSWAGVRTEAEGSVGDMVPAAGWGWGAKCFMHLVMCGQPCLQHPCPSTCGCEQRHPLPGPPAGVRNGTDWSRGSVSVPWASQGQLSEA